LPIISSVTFCTSGALVWLSDSLSVPVQEEKKARDKRSKQKKLRIVFLKVIVFSP
jgi:hypothetical protein